jgi:hypothetical protein
MKMQQFTTQKIIDDRVNKLRKLPYAEIKDRFKDECGCIVEEVSGSDGTPYQLDIQFFYDDKELQTIRVHGSLYAIQPITPWWKFWKLIDSPVATSDFIISPDGTFVDE